GERCSLTGDGINPALAVLNTFMCADTDDEAVRRSANGPGFFSYSLGYYYNPVTGARHAPCRRNVYRQFLEDTKLPDGRLLSQDEIAKDEREDEVQRALFRA